MNRVRGLIPIYEAVPNNAGAFAIAQMRASIARAEQSIANGDVIEEMRCYEDLKCYDT